MYPLQSIQIDSRLLIEVYQQQQLLHQSCDFPSESSCRTWHSYEMYMWCARFDHMLRGGGTTASYSVQTNPHLTRFRPAIPLCSCSFCMFLLFLVLVFSCFFFLFWFFLFLFFLVLVFVFCFRFFFLHAGTLGTLLLYFEKLKWHLIQERPTKKKTKTAPHFWKGYIEKQTCVYGDISRLIYCS